MKEFLQKNRHVFALGLLALVLSFGAFAMDGNVTLNLADEGYLWYGTRAVRAGQVPIRDFQAYDPGRYYWTAAWSYVFGQDAVALRASCIMFQCFGMLAGLCAARRLSRDWKFLVPVALILCMWMIPRYKVFEQSIALMAIYVGVRLIENPSRRQHFCTGMFVGAMAFMGRNHGLYQLGAFALLITLLARGAWKELPTRAFGWVTGIVIGYLPQLLMLTFVPGYALAFFALLDRNVTIGSNLGAPIHWPWAMPPGCDPISAFEWLSQGAFYVTLAGFVIFAVIRLPWLTRAQLSPRAVFVAAACVVVPYAHHTFSRADYVHLAHNVPGLCLGILAACFGTRANVPRWLPTAVSFTLLLLSACATSLHMPLVAEAILPAGSFQEVQVAGRTMHVGTYFESVIHTAERIANELAKPDEPVLFLPHYPGLYPVTGRFAPVQHLYFTRPTPGLDECTIAQMKQSGVKWVMLQECALDGQDTLRFRNTNPLIFRYLVENFAMVPLENLPPETVVLRLKEPARL